jgi:hypothetical protein
METGLIKHLEIELSASCTTSIPRVVDEAAPVTSLTPAHSVETRLTDVADANLNNIFHIITRFKPDTWEHALKNADTLEMFNDIPEGLRKGFLCGLENFSLASTFSPDNHYTCSEDEEFIISKYAEEIRLSHISPGYKPDHLFSLIGHFRRAPLAVIEQSPGKSHVIVNHSFLNNKNCIDLNNLPFDSSQKMILDLTMTSINMVVNSKKFQCTWGSFSECYLIIAEAPPRTQAAIFDVDAAFRDVPTHPSTRRFLTIKIQELIHLDHVLNFGACPAPGIWGRIADAMVQILLS